ncbi:hypothetical protein TOPH_08930 [Tolypocladium ophioglossoides CBS 100239]|uniref:Uncharacterized protein n=1 Tax=Tolypocladium ophioglossoides (strain CBS 100239) TaxID=1163406 RepID=A0A0L0MX49_TOLOC|nr:hypothetical protein TOPH_08930 [Tolypocladium ophioglossoides CBS 100239]
MPFRDVLPRFVSPHQDTSPAAIFVQLPPAPARDPFLGLGEKRLQVPYTKIPRESERDTPRRC